MFLPLKQLGSIEDLGLGLRWDAATLAREVERRANVLAEFKIGRGSIVAIAHSGSATFFADLFATWQTGAAAACLADRHLTANLEPCSGPTRMLGKIKVAEAQLFRHSRVVTEGEFLSGTKAKRKSHEN